MGNPNLDSEADVVLISPQSPRMDDFKALRRRHIDDVRRFTPEAVAHLDWSREQVLENQTCRLREVVAHAQQNSPYHSQRLGHLDANKLQLSDLPSIPPLTKADVMAHWDQIVTDRPLHLQGVTDHLDQLRAGEHQNFYYLGEYYAAATGGTSGQRGIFLWDWETFVVTANLTYRMEVRQDLRYPVESPRRTAVICAGSFVHASRLLFPTMLDPQRDVLVISAGTSIDKMIDELNDYQPDRLVGYASIVEELCAEALDGRLKIRPQRISTNSEPLLPEARRMAQDAWGINIHNTWGSVEIGLGATEGESFAGGILAEDFLIVELVNAEDLPVADPAQADRVLVTKLYGRAMPLLRYEMTDMLVIDDGPNPDAPGYRRMVDIKGRTDSWFVYPGQLKIHPMVFRGVLGQDRQISEYQVQQTGRGTRVLAIAHGEFSSAASEMALRRALADAGLEDAEVSIERVAALPRHPQTNKLKRFVPLPGS